MSVSRITSIHLPEPIGRIDKFPSSGGTSWAVDLALAGPTVYATSHEELRAWALGLLAAVDAAAPDYRTGGIIRMEPTDALIHTGETIEPTNPDAA